MSNKKIGAAIAAILFATTLYATDIETALRKTVNQFSTSIESDTTIAIVEISSDTSEMSEFMFNEMTHDFVKLHKFKVVDRANLDKIKKELDFQLSGEVDMDSIQQLGAKLGASLVIHGKLSSIGKKYRLVAQVLDVTTASIIDTSSIDVSPNKTTNYLLRTSTGNEHSDNGSEYLDMIREARDGGGYSPRARFIMYKGDIQVSTGYRKIYCGDLSSDGYCISGANYNLFNIGMSPFSVGFMEGVSFNYDSNFESYRGYNVIVGPALGFDFSNFLNFELSPGLKYGSDEWLDEDGNYLASNNNFGFSVNVTAKFFPRKFTSLIVAFQYDVTEGLWERWEKHEQKNNSWGLGSSSWKTGEASLQGLNITIGACFNFGNAR